MMLGAPRGRIGHVKLNVILLWFNPCPSCYICSKDSTRRVFIAETLLRKKTHARGILDSWNGYSHVRIFQVHRTTPYENAPRPVSTSHRQLKASCIYGPLVSGPQVTLVMASLFCHIGKQFLVFTVTPSKIKIETNQCIKSRIYGRKEDKHAKIQVRF